MAELAREEGVRIRATEVDLAAELALPGSPTGAIILGRLSPLPEATDRPLAEALQEAGLGVLKIAL